MSSPTVDYILGDVLMHDHEAGDITDLTTTLDPRYVNITGDTMTGGLTIQPATDTLTALVVNDKDSNNVLTVDTINNRVGIGVTSPGYPLDISASQIGLRLGADSTLTTRTNSTAKASVLCMPHYLTAEEDVGIYLVTSNNGYNTFNFGGGSSGKNAATYMLFYTAADGTTVTGTERMRIDNVGNVGIGTTSPTVKLHVWGASGDTGSLQVQDSLNANTYLSLGGSGLITLSRHNNSNGNLNIRTINSGAWGDPGGEIVFSPNNSEALRITRSGNVGIGTTSPGYPLDIYRAAGGNPGLRLQDGDVSIPSYASAGFGAEAPTTNTTLQIGNYSSTGGGTIFNGFSGAASIPPITLSGYHVNSPTSSAIELSGWRSDGGTNRTTLADSQLLLQIKNGSDAKVSILGSGNVGIGTTTPRAKTDILATTEQLRLTYTDNSVYSSFTLNSSGQLLIAPTGNNFNISATEVVVNDGSSATVDFRAESDTEANMLFLDANADTDGALYLGGTTNGIKINKGGKLTALGTATWYDDIRVEPTVRGSGTKVPSYSQWTPSGGSASGLYCYLFNNAVVASEKEVNFKIQLPHGKLLGSAIHLHVHWMPTSTGSAGDKVRWGLEYTKANPNAAFAAPGGFIYATDPVSPPSTTPTVDTHYITEFADIDMTGDALSTILLCRLFRNSSNAADSFAGDVMLLYIDCHVEMSQLGSNDEYSQ